MNIGMLWFDNDPKAGLDVKVERAAAYYRNKYGRKPTLCFVHPSMLPNTSAFPTSGPSAEREAPRDSKLTSQTYTAAGIEVRSTRSVLPNHLWLGFTGAPESES
jgi:hypothetical protein